MVTTFQIIVFIEINGYIPSFNVFIVIINKFIFEM